MPCLPIEMCLHIVTLASLPLRLQPVARLACDCKFRPAEGNPLKRAKRPWNAGCRLRQRCTTFFARAAVYYF